MFNWELVWEWDSLVRMLSQFMWMKDFLLHGLISKNSADSYLCFWLALRHSVSYFFYLYESPSLSLYMVFDSVSSNVDEVLSINLSSIAFVFGDFNVHHKNWLTYSGRTFRPGELCYNFWLSIKFTMGCPVLSHSLWLFSCWWGQSLWSFERCSTTCP